MFPVIHTNDFHARLNESGVERLQAAIQGLGTQEFLLLDAGDAIKAGNVDFNPFGEPILDTMSDLGYRAMAMGNREFHVLRPALETKINRARFPVLCANLRWRKPARNEKDEEIVEALPVIPSIVTEVAGVKVGILGLTVPMVTSKMRVAPLSHFLFNDAIATAKRVVPKLRAEADIVIALSHLGIAPDRKLAEGVPDLDLIIGGHTHVVLEEPEFVNGVPIVQAGSYARYYGQLEIEPVSGGKPKVTGRLQVLQAEVKK